MKIDYYRKPNEIIPTISKLGIWVKSKRGEPDYIISYTIKLKDNYVYLDVDIDLNCPIALHNYIIDKIFDTFCVSNPDNNYKLVSSDKLFSPVYDGLPETEYRLTIKCEV